MTDITQPRAALLCPLCSVNPATPDGDLCLPCQEGPKARVLSSGVIICTIDPADPLDPWIALYCAAKRLLKRAGLVEAQMGARSQLVNNIDKPPPVGHGYDLREATEEVQAELRRLGVEIA